MAWTAPITFADNTPLYAAQMNTYLRDNLMETMVANATTEGAWFMTSGVNKLVERIPQVARLATSSDTTSSTAYGDLDSSSGPVVTTDTGTQALVILSAQMSNDSSLGCLMSFAVSGASDVAANDVMMLEFGAQAGGFPWSTSNFFFMRDLTPGTNTFTAKYRATGGTMTVSNAAIIVIPF